MFAITTHGEARVGNEYQQPDLPGPDKKWTCKVRTQKNAKISERTKKAIISTEREGDGSDDLCIRKETSTRTAAR